jgi:hypothetical protein
LETEYDVEGTLTLSVKLPEAANVELGLTPEPLKVRPEAGTLDVAFVPAGVNKLDPPVAPLVVPPLGYFAIMLGNTVLSARRHPCEM